MDISVLVATSNYTLAFRTAFDLLENTINVTGNEYNLYRFEPKLFSIFQPSNFVPFCVQQI